MYTYYNDNYDGYAPEQDTVDWWQFDDDDDEDQIYKVRVHNRVPMRHGITKEDAEHAWFNYNIRVRRDDDTTYNDDGVYIATYVGIGYDTNHRLIDFVASREPDGDGSILIYHADRPPEPNIKRGLSDAVPPQLRGNSKRR